MERFSRAEAIDFLIRSVAPEEKVLVCFWTDVDFQIVAEQVFGVYLTSQEVNLAMGKIQDAYNAASGVNWGVIEDAIKAVLAETRGGVFADQVRFYSQQIVQI